MSEIRIWISTSSPLDLQLSWQRLLS